MCPVTCGSCPAEGVTATPSECQDTRSDCLGEARAGFCIISETMRTECSKTCGFCGAGRSSAEEPCEDQGVECVILSGTTSFWTVLAVSNCWDKNSDFAKKM